MRLTCAAVIVSSLSVLSPIGAEETFIQTDEYEEREGAPIGAFFGDEEYRLIEEDVERNDTGFDWTWFKSPPCEADAQAPTGGGRMKQLMRKAHGSRCPRFTSLDFDLAGRTVYIAPFVNRGGLVTPEALEEMRGSFAQAAEALGLEVVGDQAAAELALEIGFIDQMRGATTVPIYNITIQPFVTLELRLVEVATGEKLMLIRNRKHGPTTNEAAYNFADDLVKFLR